MPTAVLTTVLAASPIVLGERGIILHSSTFVILPAVPYFPWTAAPHDARYLSAAVLLPAHFIRPSSVCYCPRGLLPPRGCAPRALIRCSTHDGDFRPIIDSDIGRILLPPQSNIINADASATCYSTCYGCSARCLDGLTMVRPHRILAVGLPESAPPFVPSVAAARGFCSDFRLTYLLILA